MAARIGIYDYLNENVISGDYDFHMTWKDVLVQYVNRFFFLHFVFILKCAYDGRFTGKNAIKFLLKDHVLQMMHHLGVNLSDRSFFTAVLVYDWKKIKPVLKNALCYKCI